MRIGLIGTGIVGKALGTRLLRAGHELLIHDLDPQALPPLESQGAVSLPTPFEVATQVEVVITAVPAREEAMEVCFGKNGLASGSHPGLTHIEMSTLGPDCIREMATRATEAQVRFLEAPVSAGPQAEDHQEITLWVGGRPEVFAEHRSLLGQLAEHVVYCGPSGQAQVVKLVNNIITLGFSVILGEGLSLGVKAGVPLPLLRLALYWGTAQNRLMDDLLPNSVFSGNWRPGYTTALAEKDWRLAQALSERVQAPLKATAFLSSFFAQAHEHGWSDISVHCFLRLCEEAAAVKLRLPPFDAETP